jgi:hypothetical protein
VLLPPIAVFQIPVIGSPAFVILTCATAGDDAHATTATATAKLNSNFFMVMILRGGKPAR